MADRGQQAWWVTSVLPSGFWDVGGKTKRQNALRFETWSSILVVIFPGAPCAWSGWVSGWKEKLFPRTKWNSWKLCAPALCGAATRCLSLSRRHCPGNYTAEASRSRWSGRIGRRVPSRGTWAGRGVTAARSRWTTCWIGPWSWAAARRRGCTGTGTGPWPAGGREPAVAAAETRRASLPWPSGCHWRGRSRGCRPWPLLLPRRTGTEAGRGASAGASPEPGTRWSSSCASSTWRVGSGTRPAGRTEARELSWAELGGEVGWGGVGQGGMRRSRCNGRCSTDSSC